MSRDDQPDPLPDLDPLGRPIRLPGHLIGLDTVPTRTHAGDPAALTALEKLVLHRTDGQRSVGQIMDLFGAQRDIRSVFAELHAAGLIELSGAARTGPRLSAAAPPTASPSAPPPTGADGAPHPPEWRQTGEHQSADPAERPQELGRHAARPAPPTDPARARPVKADPAPATSAPRHPILPGQIRSDPTRPDLIRPGAQPAVPTTAPTPEPSAGPILPPERMQRFATDLTTLVGPVARLLLRDALAAAGGTDALAAGDLPAFRTALLGLSPDSRRAAVTALLSDLALDAARLP